MLGKTKHQTPVRLVNGVFVPSTQPFFQEPAGQGESGQWLYQPWAQLWISPSSLIGQHW